MMDTIAPADGAWARLRCGEETQWAYRHPARRTSGLRRRQTGLSEAVTTIAWRAQLRLCGRYQRLAGRGKVKQQIVIAVARELIAFMWEIDRATAQAA